MAVCYFLEYFNYIYCIHSLSEDGDQEKSLKEEIRDDFWGCFDKIDKNSSDEDEERMNIDEDANNLTLR